MSYGQKILSARVPDNIAAFLFGADRALMHERATRAREQKALAHYQAELAGSEKAKRL